MFSSEFLKIMKVIKSHFQEVWKAPKKITKLNIHTHIHTTYQIQTTENQG